jgi:hypothetical protein
MKAPTRRPNSTLDAAAIDRLVALRDAGASWKDIGREFNKQDARCAQIYDRAKARKAAPTEKVERQPATLSPCAR